MSGRLSGGRHVYMHTAYNHIDDACVWVGVYQVVGAILHGHCDMLCTMYSETTANVIKLQRTCVCWCCNA